MENTESCALSPFITGQLGAMVPSIGQRLISKCCDTFGTVDDVENKRIVSTERRVRRSRCIDDKVFDQVARHVTIGK